MKKLLFAMACVLGLSLIVSCSGPFNTVDASTHSYIYNVEGSYTDKISTTKQSGTGGMTAETFVPDGTPAVTTSVEFKTVVKKAVISWTDTPNTNYKNYAITLYPETGSGSTIYVDYYDSKYWVGSKDITSFLNGGNLEEATQIIGTIEYETSAPEYDLYYDYNSSKTVYYKETDQRSSIFNLTFTMIQNDSKKK